VVHTRILAGGRRLLDIGDDPLRAPPSSRRRIHRPRPDGLRALRNSSSPGSRRTGRASCRSRGVAELRLYEFDGQTEEIVNGTPISTGRAKFDKFTVMLFIGFTVSDVDKHE
jgi:hypothetical protein